MAPNFNKHGQSTRKYRWDLHDRIAIGSGTTWSAEINDAVEVMILGTTDCFYTVVDTADVAANPATNAVPLAADKEFHLQLEPGQHIAVIRQSVDGFLYVLPVDGRERI